MIFIILQGWDKDEGCLVFDKYLINVIDIIIVVVLGVWRGGFRKEKSGEGYKKFTWAFGC